MKKLLLSVAVLAAIVATSCGSSEKKAADEGDAIKAKIENCTNPDSLKVYVAQARAYAEKLQANGDEAAAKAYIDEVTPAITAKDPSAAGVFERLGEKADNALETAKEAVDSAASKTADKASEVKETVSDATKKAVDKAGDAVETAKDKTSEAVGNAADAVKGAFSK